MKKTFWQGKKFRKEVRVEIPTSDNKPTILSKKEDNDLKTLSQKLFDDYIENYLFDNLKQ
jgi:hypothetical protein